MNTELTIDHARFHGPTGTFVADTCEPLRNAAARNEVGLWAHGRGAYPGTPIGDGALPELRSVGLWEATSDQSWGLDWHRNEGIEFTAVLRGHTAFSCDGQDYELPAGAITITRPWQLHRVGRPHITASTLCWFILDVGVRRPNQPWRWPSWLPLIDSELRRITELLSHNESPIWHANKEIRYAVDRLERTLRYDTSQPLARIALSIGEILIELVDFLNCERPPLNPYLSSTERVVLAFLQSLQGHLEEPWTVDQMARACGIGKTRFIHYCKQLVNVPPLEYLTTLRIEQARKLLEDTDRNVSDIALRCGFQTSQYFSTVFRRRHGRTPTSVRSTASP